MGVAPEEVWRAVSDPDRLPTWWPGVTRVEEVTAESWTTVLMSPKGKAVRADYTRVKAEEPRLLTWRHEVEESPFERILTESTTAVTLEPEDGGSTKITLTTRYSPRGFARLGFAQMRRAAGKQLDGALEGLERLFGGVEEPA